MSTGKRKWTKIPSQMGGPVARKGLKGYLATSLGQEETREYEMKMTRLCPPVAEQIRMLVSKEPHNQFYCSLMTSSTRNQLSPRQIACIREDFMRKLGRRRL